MPNLATLAKEKLLALANNQFLTSDEPLSNRGVFLGISKENKLLFSSGELKPQNDVSDLNVLVEKVWNELNTKYDLQTVSVHVAVVHDIIYLPDPLKFNPDVDGVYMQWGDQYRGSLMPYEIKLLNAGRQRPMQKEDVLDRLATWVCKLPCSFWRSPEGMIFRLSISETSI